MAKNALVVVADKKLVEKAKQVFSSAYWKAGWKGDYLLVSSNIHVNDIGWFKRRGIIVKKVKYEFRSYNDYTTATLVKLQLFSQYFKRWEQIVYVDVDTIIEASLDALTQVNGFGAVPSLTRLKDQFARPFFNWYPGKITWNKFCMLKRDYDLSKEAFNTGVMAFNTKIITKDTPKKIKRLVSLFGESINGDQSILNLLFYNEWITLPRCYNVWHSDMKKFPYNVKDSDLNAVIFHFVGPPKDKPWIHSNIFYRKWKYFLDKSDEIDLNIVNTPVKKWTYGEINLFQKQFDKKLIIYKKISYLRGFISQMHSIMHSILGKIGKKIKNDFPHLSYFNK